MSTDAFRSNRDNFCYRHPDRPSFVLCQRCLRTICPECQTQAAVGVICPECMGEQRKSATTAQRKAERRWSRPRAIAADSRPVVTYGIIGLTLLVYLLQLIPALGVQSALAFNSAFLFPGSVVPFEPWRLLTVLLVHGSFIHVALNMLAVYMIGQSLEPLLGHGRYLALYLISGLGGSVGVALIAPGTWVVGASGAVFGMLGALLVIGRHIGANIRGILIVLGINLVIGFLPGFNVSWQAHIGGLLAGALVGLIYARTRALRQRGLQIALLTALTIGMLALLVIPPLLYV
ncbi:rhomboid family intramembrane serine protease [Microbacterium terricola]|uniref:Rhomboid family intramembrane serine protease n=1 Tax=Microbacterium terricola TaxID=344163 RepID=A0ABM8DUS9_9MICO|nr:rhomboid family intramembrane serine protease [Microbacterium terricola]UYK39891.1 rhomboid family intramembrane serine protease [Microbacterium terricola]BDV29353.1 rhomboid family intramembrane serine protease [Microbacterium terricola]